MPVVPFVDSIRAILEPVTIATASTSDNAVDTGTSLVKVKNTSTIVLLLRPNVATPLIGVKSVFAIGDNPDRLTHLQFTRNTVVGGTPSWTTKGNIDYAYGTGVTFTSGDDKGFAAFSNNALALELSFEALALNEIFCIRAGKFGKNTNIYLAVTWSEQT